MILKSESPAIKSVTSPSRDKKYVNVAYSRLMAEYAGVMPQDTLQQLASALIELNMETPNSGFKMASIVGKDTEEMLMDGAIDQTFAFSRSQFVQLSAAKIEHTDQLQTDVPNPSMYMMQ